MLSTLLLPVLWVAWLHLAAWDIGRTLAKRVGLEALRVRPAALAHALAGFALLALLALALGVLGLLHPPLLVALVIAPGARGALRLLRALCALRAAPGALRARLVEAAPLLPAAAVILVYLGTALHPALSSDDNSYHLLLPRLYLEAHALVPVATSVYAGMPHLVETLYVFPMAAGGYTAAKVLSLSFALWTLAGLGACLRARFGALASAAGTLLWLAGENVRCHLGLAHVETIAGAYLLLALLALVAFAEDGARGDLLVAGLACGMALAAKYALWFYVAPILLAVALVARARGRNPALAALPLVVALAFLVPWLARAALATGDPLFPNLTPLTGGTGWWTPIEHRHYLASQRAAGAWSGWRGLLLAPFGLCFRSPLYYCPSFSPAAMLLFVASIPLALRARGTERLVAAVALAGFAAWALSVEQGRFLVAWVPVMVLAGMHALGALARTPRRRAVAAAAVLALAAIHTTDPRALPRLAVFSTSHAEILAHDDAFRLAAVLHRDLPPQGRVLGMFENRFFFLRGPFAADSAYEAPSGLARLRSAGDAARFAARLRAEGVTHVVVGLRAAAAYEGDAFLGWSLVDPDVYPRARFAEDMRLFEDLVAHHLEPVERVGDTLVTRLRPEPDPLPLPPLP